jgi:hypothetical protein
LKYIIGGGITGLIFAFYNQDYTVITEDVGGQMSSGFTLGPRYLHKTTNAKSFLYDLGLKYKERVATVGYIDDSGWVDEPDVEFRKKYFMKSRGRNDLDGFDPSVMNSNKSSFEILDVDFSRLIDKLYSDVSDRIINSRVTSINVDDNEILVEKNGVDFIKYDHLVSTIPLNIFAKILQNNHKLKDESYEAFSMTYCLVNSDFDTGNFDFVYDARKSTKWHRMTKDNKGTVLDFFGEVEVKDLIRFTGDKYKDHKTLWNCQIVSKGKEPNIKGVKFIGRYGTWNRSWKTEKVIDEALSWQEKQHKIGKAST